LSLISQLTSWYKTNARDLPWRNTRNPYYIWVSEVILQQTQVVQGVDYYTRFIETFPDLESLSNSRARNLHFAAKTIQSELEGIFPNNFEDLLNIRGIGPYTAGAVASIAFGQRTAAVDGNVFRVLSRVYNVLEPVGSSSGTKIITQLASQLAIDCPEPGIFNQALMELGALICAPANPSCSSCPIRSECESYSLGIVGDRPVKKKKVNVKDVWYNYLLIKDGNNLLMRHRRSHSIWKNLYDFPCIEANSEIPDGNILEHFAKMLGTPSELISITSSSNLSHKLTHRNIYARFFMTEISGVTRTIPEGCEYVQLSDLGELPVPRLIDRYIDKNYQQLLSLRG
jgi:A/G-specific adenine glycosylase